MRLIERVVEPPRPCAYLPNEQAQLETLVMTDVSAEELEGLLVRGYRRFGPMYFRPRCSPCQGCISMRIPVASFSPSKTQRRIGKTVGRFRRTEEVPRLDRARLDLYRRWHAQREGARGWEPNPLDAHGYAVQFAWPHPAAREVAFHDDEAGGRLIGVGLWDVTPSARSAVFFFSDPLYAKASLGVLNVLTGIADAARESRAHVYLGFVVEGCASLAYKGNYRPHEVLVGRPGESEVPRWIPAANE